MRTRFMAAILLEVQTSNVIRLLIFCFLAKVLTIITSVSNPYGATVGITWYHKSYSPDTILRELCAPLAENMFHNLPTGSAREFSRSAIFPDKPYPRWSILGAH